MQWSMAGIAALTLIAILVGPFLIADNTVAQALYGIITTAIATCIGVWATWKFSKASDKEQLTRYGLLAWRNIDALSVKLRQQIQHGSARAETLESWLLDIDGAKWAWKDLLREVFELQARLTLESEEVAQEFKRRLEATTDEAEREKIHDEFRIALARIQKQAPLPIEGKEIVSCPNCGADVTATLASDVGSTSWPDCEGCGAIFPIHRRGDGEVSVNSDAMRIPVTKECPHCAQPITWKVAATREVHFRYQCNHCERPMQCDGSAENFRVSEQLRPDA